MVTGVDSSGVAADHGFSTGDVILEVAGKSVSTPADVRKAIASARTDGKRSVLVRVKSGDNTRFVALPVGTRLRKEFGACRRHPSPPLAVRPQRDGLRARPGLILESGAVPSVRPGFRSELQPWHPSPPLGWGR